jgi:hypothetical protein
VSLPHSVDLIALFFKEEEQKYLFFLYSCAGCGYIVVFTQYILQCIKYIILFELAYINNEGNSLAYFKK